MAHKLFSIIGVLAIALPTPTLSMAILREVGGSGGWTADGVDFAAWGQGQTFRVGDQLLFAYNPQYHNVIKVNQTEFATCTASWLNMPLNSGHDIITLATPGKEWYISGKGDDCSVNNLKVAINVLATGEAPASTPGTWPSSPPSSSITIIFGITGYLALIATTLAAVIIFA